MTNYEDKTEDPTKRKLKKSQKDGLNTYSRDFNSIIALFIAFLSFWILKDKIFLVLKELFYINFNFNDQILKENFQEIINNFFFL
ncbi:MAG: EscU/YscU/HrcU family type III secretion system export apparatus switch protein [Buchnera aphidicola (Periphyllus lyropictus)]|uniref:EscU/YscU/HrcU family type III secretion system export apparatus switch protein n=1 Tax=Buchnera aphidicola TaxID=9 RepID=UPI001EB366C6|nr:EscU/YscU/HrcU family type III secretion system export apparatus switch protein [Buchnera aphidicola]NIH16631.1 EscU/YscU/HrcU family type III secretion system export apparatus switch protein [Buchnera aphidicola (Periphyllus lyropictus)]USS94542.1 EscU/YscU/HrcU family type III secretion system export apparatus switch protein [Buchnera aphidicola (Periphyllus lyropictus)]